MNVSFPCDYIVLLGIPQYLVVQYGGEKNKRTTPHTLKVPRAPRFLQRFAALYLAR